MSMSGLWILPDRFPVRPGRESLIAVVDDDGLLALLVLLALLLGARHAFHTFAETGAAWRCGSQKDQTSDAFNLGVHELVPICNPMKYPLASAVNSGLDSPTLTISQPMNRFLVILSDRNPLSLHEMCESCAAALRQTSPKVLAILPHTILFHSEKDLTGAYADLPNSLRQDGQVILLQVHNEFRGCVRVGRSNELEEFFAL